MRDSWAKRPQPIASAPLLSSLCTWEEKLWATAQSKATAWFSNPSHTRESSQPRASLPAQNSRYVQGPWHSSGSKSGVLFPTFPRSGCKHQRAHWGPAHSKQVFVGQLQGCQGLGLQHGVQVDVAVRPCAQEKVPRQDARQRARQGGECWVSWSTGPPWTPKPGTPLGNEGPTPSGHKNSNGEKLGPRQTAGPFSNSVGPPRPPGARWPPLPVEGGTAHRVDGTPVGREDELCRRPQGHGARPPREGGLFRRQGALEWEAAFRAQNEKAGVKAGEGHRRGAHLGLSPGRLWRDERQGRAKGIQAQSPKEPVTQMGAVAQGGQEVNSRPTGSSGAGAACPLQPPPTRGLLMGRGPLGAAAGASHTFLSLVFLGSCCTTSAKPSVSCSWPAPSPCQSSTFPSVAALNTWKRWLCRGSGSQTTWGDRMQVQGRGKAACSQPAPTSQQTQRSPSAPPAPSRKTRILG